MRWNSVWTINYFNDLEWYRMEWREVLCFVGSLTFCIPFHRVYFLMVSWYSLYIWNSWTKEGFPLFCFHFQVVRFQWNKWNFSQLYGFQHNWGKWVLSVGWMYFDWADYVAKSLHSYRDSQQCPTKIVKKNHPLTWNFKRNVFCLINSRKHKKKAIGSEIERLPNKNLLIFC